MKIIKKTLGLVLLGTVVLTLSFCSSKKEVTSTDNNSSSKAKRQIILNYEKTSCYGRCPAYIFKLFSNLDCRIEPKAFAFADTIWEGKVTKNQSEKIFKTAQEIGFWEMKSVYDDTLVMDVPSTYFRLKEKGVYKEVKNRYNGPKSLRKLATVIEEVAKNARWKKN